MYNFYNERKKEEAEYRTCRSWNRHFMYAASVVCMWVRIGIVQCQGHKQGGDMLSKDLREKSWTIGG